jgi:hypothetical protein
MTAGTCDSSSFVLLLDPLWCLIDDHELIPRPDRYHGVSSGPPAIPAGPAAIPAAPLLSQLAPLLFGLALLFPRRSYCGHCRCYCRLSGANQLPSFNIEVYDGLG